ncbi:MAG: tRNA (adenosine(37)-N6)-threonylcarbamoyltransferase complex dimerization subunit type 1 TsaB [Rhodospirillum sp.]|nr:tRNA (adenosine(37)-N6)-threonylcarbamoyltransferase complex dimerization subunit type 1 TsaB [Rhodospirillum sp.]MCF8489031.1 tRNA (adenosine(37)-N6)-threonylcarbamoyltransferase complex dimerization subunit type 1 TsaB [Rhodospirillum sp.]MCF8499780.1 tRNA (adenosine(37)-N6)-threonylcarbamoyltransferase complex dimerization subunit type 1 TsaB [Rhodospirillum sp.]
MTLALCIDTSDGHSHVVLGDEGGVRATQDRGRDMDTAVFLPQAVRDVLTEAERDLADIDLIAVNIGPGGLSATRCGVSFANALSFALGRPILGVDHLTLLGRRAQAVTSGAVVCLKRAANAHAYVGLYDGRSLSHLVFGPARAAVSHVLDKAGEGAILSGDVQALKDPALTARAPTLGEGESALAPRLLQLALEGQDRAGREPVEPLNELDARFTRLEQAKCNQR